MHHTKGGNGKRKNSLYMFDEVHTGDDSTDPGVLKAQENKRKREEALKKYKEKSDQQKKLAIENEKRRRQGKTLLKTLNN